MSESMKQSQVRFMRGSAARLTKKTVSFGTGMVRWSMVLFCFVLVCFVFVDLRQHLYRGAGSLTYLRHARARARAFERFRDGFCNTLFCFNCSDRHKLRCAALCVQM